MLPCYVSAVERTCFDILADLFAQDVDRALEKGAAKKTPGERLQWLEDIQAFAEEARRARQRETESSSHSPE